MSETRGPIVEPPPSERDLRLAEVLAACTDQARQGETPDFERLTQLHPDLVDELRELWRAGCLADELVSHVADHLPNAAPPETLGAVAGPVPLRLPFRVGDYELTSELGRGGMGIVYRARQISLDRTVALKMLLRAELASAGKLARFRAEAEAAARLEHPHLVPVYEVGQVDGQPFFSMQLIEGTTLARRLSEGPLPPRQAAEMLAAVARAVDFAHRHGVLHRDLKPANILLDADQHPYVSDFGLAKQVAAEQELTHSGAILGTPSYMSPEQAAGSRGEIGPASDVYSLGAILYQMLTGRPPFQAATPVDTVLLVLEQDPVPPRVLNPRADRDLEMIALRCLQKPAELRYASAGALADDLEAYLAGEPVSARSGGFSEVLSRVFRETHHATVLENWGLLWMWHSLALMVLCVVTTLIQWRGVSSPWPYLAVWGLGLGTWAVIFWMLRRRAGPVTFVERQVAHIWAASVLASVLLFFIEIQMGLPVLTLSPVLALTSGMIFLIKASILTGAFYIQAVILFLLTFPMALWPQWGVLMFGFVSGACFLVPGWKYHRQRLRSQAAAATG